MRGMEETTSGEFRTTCHTCGGAGQVRRPKFAILQGMAGTVHTLEPCPDCPRDPDEVSQGTGWLPGFQPPV